MAWLSRLPLLSRLAARYAVRHRGQTVRALLGLLVSTTVLAAGLGLGDSIGTSLEEVAAARFGPIDLILASRQPFDASLARELAEGPAGRAHGLTGVPSLYFTGSAAHPARELAEAFSTLRGVTGEERAVFGPLRSPTGQTVPEPSSGEVVLTEDLARSLEARPGDRVVFRAQAPGSFRDLRLATVNYTGVAGGPAPVPGLPAPVTGTYPLTVEEDALGLAAFALFPPGSGATVTVEARGPQGIAFANRSAQAPVFLLVEPPLAPGEWTIRITSTQPIVYNGTAGVAYPPPGILSGGIVLEARVAAIIAAEGRSGFTARPTALVPLADLQRAAGLTGAGNLALWRVAGDADAAAAAVRDALPDEVAETGDVEAVKAEAARLAARASAGIAGFLLVMGGFTLVSGILLAYALFSALVEERRSELGIARALGLTRAEVALTMTLEGALYAAVAALAGLLLGLAILAAFMAGLRSVVLAEGGPPIGFHVTAGTLVWAWALGTLIPLITIALGSLRFAALDPSRAIRGIPDDPRTRRRAGLVVGGVLIAVGLLLSLDPLFRLVGVPIALAGVGAAAATRGWRIAAGAAFAAAVLHGVWTLYTFEAFPDNNYGEEMDPVLTLARGAVLALLLAALAVASPAPYRLALRAWAAVRGVSRSGFVAVQYLTSRRVAAGLTMAMIALVVVVVTVMGTLFLLFGAQIPEHEAGYQVVGESPLRLEGLPSPLPSDLASEVDRIDILYRHFELKRTNFTLGGNPVGDNSGIQTFLGVTDGFAEGNQYVLTRRAAQYADDRAAWRAVAAGEAVIVPYWYPQGEFGPGDRVGLHTVLAGQREYAVAGLVRTDYVFGAFLGADEVRAMGFPTGSMVFVRAEPGSDPSRLAHRLTASYGDEGVTFVSVPEEAARFAAITQAFVLVAESFLSLGLFVGLAATGFLASRAVHERARDIGTLRALGYEERDIGRAFVLESVVTAGVGLLVGLVVGILVAHSVWWRSIQEQGVDFVLPWTILLTFIVLVLGLAALAAWRPARRAARLPPALAVRWVE